jgi:hypothetical protein
VCGNCFLYDESAGTISGTWPLATLGDLGSYSLSYRKRINTLMIVRSSSGISVLFSAASYKIIAISKTFRVNRNRETTHLAHREPLGPLKEPRLRAYDRLVDSVGIRATGDNEVRIIARS